MERFSCCQGYRQTTVAARTCLWSRSVWKPVGREATYQNSRSYRRDGVPPLSPVHIAVAVPASDSVQETWHDSAVAVAWKVQTATQLVINLNQIKNILPPSGANMMILPTNELPWRNNRNNSAFIPWRLLFNVRFYFASMCRRNLLFVA